MLLFRMIFEQFQEVITASEVICPAGQHGEGAGAAPIR